MKIKIFYEESFLFEKGFSKEQLENAKEVQLDMIGKKMGFFVNGKLNAVLVGSICQYDQFVEKIIFYTTIKHEKNILFELVGEQNLNQEKLNKMIKIRNMSAVYKSPLKCEFSIKERDSIFADKKKPVDLRGMLNVFMLFSILNYYRLMVRHTRKFGSFFYDNINLMSSQLINKNLFFFLIFFMGFLVLLYQIQIWVFQNKMKEKTANLMLIAVHTIYLTLSIYLALTFQIPFVLSGFMNLTTMILFLKGISYSHVLSNVRFYIKVLNKEIDYNQDDLEKELSNFNREIIEKHQKDFTKFLTVSQFLYFIIIPSLCYQLKFPRNEKIRKRFLAKRIAELIVIQIFQLFLTLEYWLPILQRSPQVFSKKPIDKEYIQNVIRYMIQLAGPGALSWLLFFFLFFHHIPNIISEIMKFGDRHFYNDWWNCKNLGQYWRDWNLPVHNWFLRHIAFPLSYYGVPKYVSNIIIFFLSAVVHEYLFSLAIGQIKFYIFLSFFFQVFYMIGEKYLLKLLKLEHSYWGNFLFWWNFCVIGQPVLAVVYYLGRVE